MTNKEKAAYIRGFADGEGCVPKLKTASGKYYQRRIVISNTNHHLLKTIGDYLADLGIEYRIKIRQKMTYTGKSVYKLNVSNYDNLLLWQKLIGFNDQEKTRRLKILLQGYKYKSKKGKNHPNYKRFVGGLNKETYEFIESNGKD